MSNLNKLSCNEAKNGKEYRVGMMTKGKSSFPIGRLTEFEGQIVWDSSKANGQPRRKSDTTPSNHPPASRHRCPSRKGCDARLSGIGEIMALTTSLGVGLWLSAMNVQFRDVR